MKPRLFGTSGIRGLANVEVTPILALRVGAALASQLEAGAIVVGRDTRLSGKMLEAALVSGIASCGADATILGVVPTPVLAFLTREMEASAGVSISASHNPPEYNGLKLFDSTGRAYTEEQQLRLEARMDEEKFKFSAWDEVGAVNEADMRQTYVDAVVENLRPKRRWNVACDLFNGATCTVIPELFRRLQCDAALINAQPDGQFPAGDPEPSTSSLQRLGRMVVTNSSEIGFGFDGDGDRMMAVDERGTVPTPDRVLAAYAGYVVRKGGGGVVVTHVGASMCIDDAVRRAGGTVLRTRVGDVSVAEAMVEHSAVFGGEPIGAWIHPKVHLCPDGILSALKLLEALDDCAVSLSEFVSDVPEYPILNAKLECPNHRKAEVMKAVSERYSGSFRDVRSVSTVDGVRLDLEDGWTLVRPSGTEPVIRVTVEARDIKLARELMERSQGLIKSALEGDN